MKNKKNLFLLIVLAALLAITVSFAFAFTPTQAAKTQAGVIPNNSYIWAKAIGGTGYDEGNAITTDSSGNVYTTGSFKGTVDFDPSAGTANLTSKGQSDVFVSKLDSAGNFMWAKSFGSLNSDEGNAIAVDSSGNVYITGSFLYNTVDFDPSVEGTANLTNEGAYDIFVSKLDTDGNFVWAKSFGSLNSDEGNAIAVDNVGNVYTTGYFVGTVDFDPGIGTINLKSAGSPDIFVSKLDTDGDFVWAKSFGAVSYDYGNAIAVDSSGNVYTTGSFERTVDFDPGAGTVNLTSAGGTDIFVSKLDTDGDFVWAKAMGGTSTDHGRSIAVDSGGNVYTTGSFYSTADFDPGASTANITSLGYSDIFVSKLDSAGDFVWVKSFGEISHENGFGITVNSSGDVYTTGYFQSTADFDPGAGTVNLTSAGSYDIFVSKLDTDGDFVWAKSLGGTNLDVGLGIAVNNSGDIYTTGYFESTADFDPGAGTVNLTSAGNFDIFISKLGIPPIPSTPTGLTASDGEFTDKVKITWTAITYATRYEIYRDTGGSATKVGESTTTTTYKDTTVVPGTTYTYTVKACNVSGCSAISTTDTGYLKLASPLNLQASDGTYSNQVKVTWNSVTDATSYEIYRLNGTSWIKRATTTDLFYKDTATTPLVSYKYKVKACNAYGCSAKSTLDTGYRGKLVTTQLVRNLGFEIDTDKDGIPNFWTRYSNNKLDKRICSPAAKHLGKCGYRFLGDNVARKDWIRQNLSAKALAKGGGHNGDKLILSFYARSLRLELADGAYVLVKVRNSATNKQQVIRVNLTGTHAYKKFTKTLKVTIGNYDQVWVYVYANGTATENLYVDNVTVRLQYIQTK